jgi:hypothetical protein
MQSTQPAARAPWGGRKESIENRVVLIQVEGLSNTVTDSTAFTRGQAGRNPREWLAEAAALASRLTTFPLFHFFNPPPRAGRRPTTPWNAL